MIDARLLEALSGLYAVACMAGFAFGALKSREAGDWFFTLLRTRHPDLGEAFGKDPGSTLPLPTRAGIKAHVQINRRLDYILLKRYQALEGPELRAAGKVAYRWHIMAFSCVILLFAPYVIASILEFVNT